tara:strand:+ start:280 stop:1110 length:831 start_codon:yes stop_codon:yes gene_type:complete
MDSKKIMIVILVIALFIAVFGNQGAEEVVEDVSEEVVQDVCTARAICIDDNSRAYRNADCSLTDEETCSNGCEAGACLSAPVETVVIDSVPEVETTSSSSKGCDIGLACLDANRKGYRTSDCTFSNVQACPYGCGDGKCLSASEADFIEGAKDVATSGTASFDTLAWRFSDFSEERILVEENYDYDAKVRFFPQSNRYNYFIASGFSNDIWIIDTPIESVAYQDCKDGLLTAVSYSRLRTDQTLCIETRDNNIAAMGGTWQDYPDESVELTWKLFE